MRREALFSAAVAALFAVAPGVAAAQEWNHDPASAVGPLSWGDVAVPFGTCGTAAKGEVGKRQSPIDIVAAQPAAVVAPTFAYAPTPFVIENTGHVIEVPVVPGSLVTFGSDTYELVQLHFHTPSEHTVNGRLSSMELHLVHRDALGNLAVVGVLLEVGRTPTNKLIDEIFRLAPAVAETSVQVGRTINAKDLLPPPPRSFWTYSGSLTTPPCSEGVRWTVLKTPVGISAATMLRYEEIIGALPGYDGYKANNRPVAKQNGRPILSN
jgi:carbonic anhydrase